MTGSVRTGGFESFLSTVSAVNLPAWRSLHLNPSIEVAARDPAQALNKGYLDAADSHLGRLPLPWLPVERRPPSMRRQNKY